MSTTFLSIFIFLLLFAIWKLGNFLLHNKKPSTEKVTEPPSDEDLEGSLEEKFSFNLTLEEYEKHLIKLAQDLQKRGQKVDRKNDPKAFELIKILLNEGARRHTHLEMTFKFILRNYTKMLEDLSLFKNYCSSEERELASNSLLRGKTGNMKKLLTHLSCDNSELKAKIHYHLCIIYDEQLDLENAQKEIQKAIRYAPSDLKILNKLSILTLTLKKSKLYGKVIYKINLLMRKDPEINPIDLARSYLSLGSFENEKKNFKKAEKLLRKALDLAMAHEQGVHTTALQAQSMLGNLLLFTNRFEDAEIELNAVVNLCEKILPPEHPSFFQAYSDLSLCYETQKKSALAESLLEKLMQHQSATLEIHERLAKIYQSTQRYLEAEKIFKAILAQKEKSGAHPEQLSSTEIDLGYLYIDEKQYAQAEKYLLNAIKHIHIDYGSNSTKLVLPLTRLGEIQALCQNFEEAKNYYKRAFTIAKNDLKHDDPIKMTLLKDLGELYLSLKKFIKAEELFQRWLHIYNTSKKGSYLDLSLIYSRLSETYINKKKFKLAYKNYEQWIEAIIEKQGDKHEDLINPLNCLAALETYEGAYDKAEKKLNKSMTIAEENLGKKHPQIAEILTQQGVLYRLSKRFEEAEEALSRSLDIMQHMVDPKHSSMVSPYEHLAQLYQEMGKKDLSEEFSSKAKHIQNSVGKNI